SNPRRVGTEGPVGDRARVGFRSCRSVLGSYATSPTEPGGPCDFGGIAFFSCLVHRVDRASFAWLVLRQIELSWWQFRKWIIRMLNRRYAESLTQGRRVCLAATILLYAGVLTVAVVLRAQSTGSGQTTPATKLSFDVISIKLDR